jgi:hypothetical protein
MRFYDRLTQPVLRQPVEFAHDAPIEVITMTEMRKRADVEGYSCVPQ